MANRVPPPKNDTERIERWRTALIEDLGDDLRQCVRWMHSASDSHMVTVLNAMVRCGVPRPTIQGVEIYWMHLTLEARASARAAAGKAVPK